MAEIHTTSWSRDKRTSSGYTRNPDHEWRITYHEMHRNYILHVDKHYAMESFDKQDCLDYLNSL